MALVIALMCFLGPRRSPKMREVNREGDKSAHITNRRLAARFQASDESAAER